MCHFFFKFNFTHIELSTVSLTFSFYFSGDQTFIKSTLAAKTDNPYGWWTSLNDQLSEGYWAFGDNTIDQSLM